MESASESPELSRSSSSLAMMLPCPTPAGPRTMLFPMPWNASMRRTGQRVAAQSGRGYDPQPKGRLVVLQMSDERRDLRRALVWEPVESKPERLTRFHRGDQRKPTALNLRRASTTCSA